MNKSRRDILAVLDLAARALAAGGILQATVVTSASDTARFTFGANGAKGQALDFDLRDREAEVRRAGTVVLSVTMPD